MLRELVEASPHDDAPRLVYADHLLEKQDPRGEFIALSFEEGRRHLDAKERKKLATIRKTHERSWLGPVFDATSSRRYHHGFLDECQIATAVARSVREASLGHHAWATVRSLACGYDAFSVDLALHPCMRGLQKVEGLAMTALLQLATHPTTLGIEEIELSYTLFGWHGDPGAVGAERLVEQLDLLAMGPGLRRLERLRIRSVFEAAHLVWLSGTALGQKLVLVDVSNQWPKSLDVWIEGLRRLDIPAAINLGFGTLKRGRDGVHSVLHLHLDQQTGPSPELIAAMGRIPANALTELEIRGAPEPTWPTYRAPAARQQRLAQPALIGGTRLQGPNGAR